jgi:hypothetical protein
VADDSRQGFTQGLITPQAAHQFAQLADIFRMPLQIIGLAQRVRCQFDSVVHRHDVDGIHRAVYHSLAVQVAQRREGRKQDGASIVLAERALLECGVAVWGAGWRKTRLKDYCRGEMVEVEEYVRAYAGATVALNFHREGPEGEVPSSSGCNARTFELAAMGVAQVVDAREDLPHLFEDGSEVVTFSDPSALKGIVRELVSDHARAEELGHAARRRALGEHTYMHRLSLLLEDQLGA